MSDAGEMAAIAHSMRHTHLRDVMRNRDRMRWIALETFAFYEEDPSRRAVKEGGCAYRDALGRKCALGRYILDAHYTSELEGWSAHGLAGQAGRIDFDSLLAPEHAGLSLFFWACLQAWHDRAGNWEVGSAEELSGLTMAASRRSRESGKQELLNYINDGRLDVLTPGPSAA